MNEEIDLFDLKQGQVIKDWLIWENLGPNDYGNVYQVSDLKLEQFGKLYIEKVDEDLSIIMGSISFLSNQQWAGNSFRFSTVIGAQLFEEKYAYMVTQDRPGPTLQQLLDCEKVKNRFDTTTCAYFAIDFLQTIESIVNAGHVLRDFNPNHWKFDTNSRVFYLADVSDVIVGTDKRSNILKRPIPTDYMGWKGTTRYAPVSYSKYHQMDELDMIEMSIFIFYDLVIGKLPWDSVKDLEKLKKLKDKFLYDWKKHLNDELQNFETVLRNMTERLKHAHHRHIHLNTKPILNGAWCPNGKRAGALSSAVNYASFREDFHRIIMHDQSIINWREAVLCFEVEICPEDMNPEYEEISKSLELSKNFAHELEIQKRNKAKRKHYEVLTADHEAEKRRNEANAQLCLNFLIVTKMEEEDEAIDEKVENLTNKKVATPKKRGRKKRVSSPVNELVDVKVEPLDEEQDVKIENVEDEPIDEMVEDLTSKKVATPKKRGRKKLVSSPVMELVDVKIEPLDEEPYETIDNVIHVSETGPGKKTINTEENPEPFEVKLEITSDDETEDIPLARLGKRHQTPLAKIEEPPRKIKAVEEMKVVAPKKRGRPKKIVAQEKTDED